MRRTLLTSMWLLGAALAARCNGTPSSAQPGMEPPPTPVETVVVAIGRLDEVFEAVGTVEAAEKVTLAFETDGRIAALPFREGEPLAEGAIVARLADGEIEATLARAVATRDLRQTTFERILELVGQGVANRQQHDDAEAALRVAEAEVALASAQLAKTRLLAPFDGIVGSRLVSPGAYVRAGDAIAELAQIRDVKISVSVPERFLGAVRRGATITVATPAFPGRELEGEVRVVDPVLDPATRAGRVVARVRNADGILRPGMSADVRLVLSVRDRVLTIPGEAVFFEGDQALVYKVEADGTARRRPVRLGSRRADVVEVSDGLETGSVVVRAGHQKLFDGARVASAGAAEAAAGS